VKNSLFTGYFDEEIAYDLFGLYCRGELNPFPDELIRQLAALVAKVFRIDFAPTDRIDLYEASLMQSDALEHLYLVVSQGDIQMRRDTSGNFRSYLWATARNAMLMSMRTMKCSEFDLWEGCAEPETGRLITQHDSEQKLYFNELRVLTLSAFKADVRFSGNDARACVFIASCFLGFCDLDPMAAKARYKLTDAKTKFLMQYTRCALQSSVYAVRAIDERA